MNIHALFMHIYVSSEFLPILLNTVFVSRPLSPPVSLYLHMYDLHPVVWAMFSPVIHILLVSSRLVSAQVCLPWQMWRRRALCENFLFILTFHLNVSLFVCQFEVLKRGEGASSECWKKYARQGGNDDAAVFDCSFCCVCEKLFYKKINGVQLFMCSGQMGKMALN